MQLINDFEKIMVKSPGRELSSAFGTSKDNLRLLKYPNMYAWGYKRSCGGVFATFVCKPILKQYIIRLLQYIHMGIFKRLVWFYLQFVS